MIGGDNDLLIKDDRSVSHIDGDNEVEPAGFRLIRDARNASRSINEDPGVQTSEIETPKMGGLILSKSLNERKNRRHNSDWSGKMINNEYVTKEGLLEIINALPIAISIIDQDIKVALTNRMTHLFVNKDESQLIGQVGGEAFGCVHHDDVPKGCGFGSACLRCILRETILNTMANRKPYNMIETSMNFKTVGERHLRISTLPMSLSGEDVVLLGIEDITEAKEHEAIRMQNEKLSAVIETAGAVCHELNQPLTVISGFSELLLEDIDEGDPLHGTLKRIHDQAVVMSSITRKLMSVNQYKTKNYLSGRIIDLQEASKY